MSISASKRIKTGDGNENGLFVLADVVLSAEMGSAQQVAAKVIQPTSVASSSTKLPSPQWSNVSQIVITKATTDEKFVKRCCHLAENLIHKGQPGRALNEYSIGLNQKTDNKALTARQYHIQQLAYFKLGKFEEAIKMGFAGIGQEHGNKELKVLLHFYQGLTYKRQGNRPEAVREYNNTLALEPQDKEFKAGLHLNLGRLYQEPSTLHEAFREYKKGLELEHENNEVKAKLHCNLGETYLSLGHREWALDEFREGKKVAPSHSRVEECLLSKLTPCYTAPGQIV